MSRIETHRPIHQKADIDRKTERRLMNEARDWPACEACGKPNDGTIVGAHCNIGGGGTGYRVPGAVAFLCKECHDIADGRLGDGSLAHLVWVRVAQKLMQDRARSRMTPEGEDET